MNTCNVCNKNVTKKSPAITCCQCDTVVHERVECSGLNNKQRAALRAAESLEWVCNKCQMSSSRRTSFLTIDDDEDEDTLAERSGNLDIDMKKLFANITKEVNKIVMRELAAVMKSVEHASHKIDEYEETMKNSTNRIADLERKQTALKNQNTHLELKVAALEQRLESLDQAALMDYIEIVGIPYQENEDITKIVHKVGSVLQVGDIQVRSARRISTRKGKAATILVQLNNEHSKPVWIDAGRRAEMRCSSVLPILTGEAAFEKIIVREALTGRTKYLLSKAKTDLKETQKFKFVWCKFGKVMARKDEKSKVYWIRSDDDIASLSS